MRGAHCNITNRDPQPYLATRFFPLRIVMSSSTRTWIPLLKFSLMVLCFLGFYEKLRKREGIIFFFSNLSYCYSVCWLKEKGKEERNYFRGLSIYYFVLSSCIHMQKPVNISMSLQQSASQSSLSILMIRYLIQHVDRSQMLQRTCDTQLELPSQFPMNCEILEQWSVCSRRER